MTNIYAYAIIIAMNNPNTTPTTTSERKVTVQVPADVASDPQLRALAVVDGHTDEYGHPNVGPGVVDAVDAYIEARQADPTLPQQVEQAQAQIDAEPGRT